MYSTVRKWNKWANAHSYLALDLLRIALGIFLFLKGADFFQQSDNLVQILNATNEFGSTGLIVHYVAMSHFAGGLFIAMGLVTRISLLFQLPILLGAVVVNFTGEMVSSNLLQASIALTVALFFTFYGSGRHSLDYKFKLRS
jgi:putative oxidoreductase